MSHDRLGNVLVAEGKLAEARQAYEAGLDIAERLARDDPGNAQAQRDLSVSHNKLGDVLVDEGKLAEARQAYEAGLGVRERFARGDPGNARAQRDLFVSHDRLAGLGGGERRTHLTAALAILKALDAENRLAPRDRGHIESIERQLRDA